MKQEDIFSTTEANSWFLRNKDVIKNKSREKDITYQYINQIIPELQPKKILEIGCCNGYRLNWLTEDFSIECIGIEPSSLAIKYGTKQFKDNDLLTLINTKVDDSFWRNDFNHLFEDDSLDMIIFGHCFYLISPEMYFLITYQIDRAIREHGVIVIFDFDTTPQRTEYEHYKTEKLWSYKMDFSQLFSRHPMYKLISKNYINYDQGLSQGNVHKDCSLAIIKKIKKDNAFVRILPES
jgi:predicted O-methyltransferase YrrM